MAEKKKQPKKEVVLEEGYQPIKKGHQPTQGNLDASNPPQGGSGVPSGPAANRGENKKANKSD